MSIHRKDFRVPVATVLLLAFSTALGIAIWKHIDGLGIFSIVLGVVFCSFLLLGESGAPDSDEGWGSNIGKNLSHLVNKAQDPKFIKLLSILIGAISKIESKIDRLEEKHDTLHQAVLKLSEDLKPSPKGSLIGKSKTNQS